MRTIDVKCFCFPLYGNSYAVSRVFISIIIVKKCTVMLSYGHSCIDMITYVVSYISHSVVDKDSD